MDVRLVRPEEIEELPAIERSAAEAFRGSSQDPIADDEVSPAWLYPPFVEQGLAWVAEASGALIGFAACEAFADALHLWELAVRREHQGQGAGRALVAVAAGEARARGLPAVTLTTFRDIPWNAPFYARLGFRPLGPNELNPRLAAVLARERERGLDADARCAMRLAL